MGPYNHANTTIGRAYSLLSQNGQGGSVPGETYMGALGNPLAYSLCFAENEERSPWVAAPCAEGFQANRQRRERVRRQPRHSGRLRARAIPGRQNSGAASTATAHHAALRDARSDRRAPVPSPRHQFEGRSDRLVRPKCPPAGTRLLGRPVDADAGAAARSRRRRALSPRVSRPRPTRSSKCTKPNEINVVVVGGETQGAWKIFGANYVTTVSVDAWR